MSDNVQIALLLFLLLCSSFFSGIETGFISLNRLRLLHLVRAGQRNAQIVQNYLLDTARMMGTTLTGNNLVNVAFTTLTASFAERHFDLVGQSAASLLTALSLLVCGEFLPKLYFTSRPLERTLRLARLFLVIEYLLKPFSMLMMALTAWAAPKRRQTNDFMITREHILSIVRTEDDPSGAQISAFERFMINRVLDLQSRTAAQIMTPLDRAATLLDTDSVATAFIRVRERGHTRLPVFSADSVYCHGIFDCFAALHSQNRPAPEAPVTQSMDKPFYIAHDTPADDVLPLMRRHRQTMGVVRDTQTGRLLGILTQENVLAVLTQGIRKNKERGT